MTESLRENVLRAFRVTPTGEPGDAITVFLDRVFDRYRDAKRKTGEPYLHYVSHLAVRLAEYRVDQATLLAAFTWGLFELSPDAANEIKKELGDEVYELAFRLARLSGLESKSNEDAEHEKLRRLILALAKDVRVVFLRLLDRAHVLSVIDQYPGDNPRFRAKTARELYAPLANRLGIGRLKNELEDSSLRILEPEVYFDIRRRVKERSDHHAMNIERIKLQILESVEKQGIRAIIKGRIKSINSIYEKMLIQKIDFDQVYDVIGLRIIAENEGVQDCYGVLGLIHSLWKPIPHRFKDFIAVPKENGYQSIHTSVIGPKGTPLEIQIRSQKMDEVAEAGIAAHWRYKESGNGKLDASDKFTWLRRVMNYLTEEPNPSDMVEIFKVDMFPTEVYVFTPKGDVKSLPAGSTIVDFAFAIHSEVGFRCKHGKINKKLMPLKTKLSNGDIVEIITARNSHPNPNWLKFVRTSVAKNKIRSFLREEARDSMVKEGLELLKKELRRQRLPVVGLIETEEFLEVVNRSGFASSDDLFAALGFREYSIQHVINRLMTLRAARHSGLDKSEEIPSPVERASDQVKVISGADVMTRFARCCEPMPGDPIVGYITQGRGITIHSADCPGLKKLGSERKVPVKWSAEDDPKYPARIVFEGYQMAELTQEVSRVLQERGAVVVSQRLEMIDMKRQRVRGTLLVESRGESEMDSLVNALRTIPGIKKITRSQSRKNR